MRYFFHENAALPLAVGSRTYVFEVTDRVAGTVQGVLAIADDAEAEAFKAVVARLGVEEIDATRYEAALAKKKSRGTPWLRPNYDPSVRPEQSIPPAPSVAPAVAAAEAVRAEATSFKGSGQAIVVEEGASGVKPVETLPSADDLFGTGKVTGDGVEAAVPSGKARGRKAGKRENALE